MDAEQDVRINACPRRVIAWWLAGVLVLLASLWAGPGAWAKEIGTCGEGTVPGPCGVNDGAGASFNTPILINVLSNDLDSIGQGLKVTGVTTASNGLLEVNPNNTVPGDSVTYIPNNGFSGVDRFAYSLQDASGVGAQAEVVVVVAPEGKPAPFVGSIQPNQANQLQFTQTVPFGGRSAPITVADERTAPITVTVEVAPGTFAATPGISDTLAIVVSTVLTPAGQMTGTATAGSLFLFYRYANLTIDVEALLNKQWLTQNFLNKPMTLTVSIDNALLAGLNPNSLTPLQWNGNAWSSAGIQVVQRTPGSSEVTFTIDRVIGELSFFARPGAEILMPQISALRLPPVE